MSNARKRFDEIRHKEHAGEDFSRYEVVHDMLAALMHEVLGSDEPGTHAIMFGKLTAWIGMLFEGTSKQLVLDLIEKTLDEELDLSLEEEL